MIKKYFDEVIVYKDQGIRLAFSEIQEMFYPHLYTWGGQQRSGTICGTV